MLVNRRPARRLNLVNSFARDDTIPFAYLFFMFMENPTYSQGYNGYRYTQPAFILLVIGGDTAGSTFLSLLQIQRDRKVGATIVPGKPLCTPTSFITERAFRGLSSLLGSSRFIILFNSPMAHPGVFSLARWSGSTCPMLLGHC